MNKILDDMPSAFLSKTERESVSLSFLIGHLTGALSQRLLCAQYIAEKLEILVTYIKGLLEQESFESEKYGNYRCVSTEGWFSQGLRDNIVGDILEYIEELGWLKERAGE